MTVSLRKPVGRESVVMAKAEERRLEIAALKWEASVHAQRCLPVAKRLLNSALYFGIPDAVRDASYLVGALEAMARRHAA